MSEEEFYLRRDLFLNELDKQNIDYIYEDYIQKEKEYKEEIERLNNIINGVEDLLKRFKGSYREIPIQIVLNEIRELKGVDKE